ncbi:arginase family protein [Halenospora varia]|nr:arginase family protein [Halenospora varia]
MLPYGVFCVCDDDSSLVSSLDWPYNSLGAFAKLPFVECTSAENTGSFNIGIVGHSFDLGTSYRSGQRFGPNGVRQAARKMRAEQGYDLDHDGVNPFRDWATVVDCGNLSNTPFDKWLAVYQLDIGGDHTITSPNLRALHFMWGSVAVLHFDSHLDTWDSRQLSGGVNNLSDIKHGTFLHNDLWCGFQYIRAREIDKIGVGRFVYLTVDIDVLDPTFAPATSTIETSGWTTRELLAMLKGLSDGKLTIVGADVVEFTPIYDNAAETPGMQ